MPGRFEEVDEGQPFTVLVDYAHKPDALENVLRTARDLGPAACSASSAAAATATARSGRRWGGSPSELADLAILTSDNPRSEDPQAIIEEILGGAPATLRSSPTGGARSSARSRRRGRATSS